MKSNDEKFQKYWNTEIHTNIRNANDASCKTLTSQVQALIKSLWKKSLCHACGSNQLGCKVVWSATSCVRFANTNLQVGNWNIPSHKSLPCYRKVNSINARNLFKIATKSMPCLIDHVTPKPFKKKDKQMRSDWYSSPRCSLRQAHVSQLHIPLEVQQQVLLTIWYDSSLHCLPLIH